MDKITGNVWLDNEVWFVITHEHVKAMNTEFLKKTEYLRHNEDAYLRNHLRHNVYGTSDTVYSCFEWNFIYQHQYIEALNHQGILRYAPNYQSIINNLRLVRRGFVYRYRKTS